MKITSLFFAAATAAPLAPVRRNSQEVQATAAVEQAEQPLEQPVEQPVKQPAEQLADFDSDDLFSSDADFEAYMKYLDELPSEEWEQVFDTLANALEAKLGIDFEDLDKLSDEEFNRLVESL